MSDIAIVRVVGYSDAEMQQLSRQLQDVPRETHFIVTDGDADYLSKEQFADLLDEYADVAGYDLVEQ
jgi:hypothetical protein